eukprot:3929952-Pyramimonas_sp.AAC.1
MTGVSFGRRGGGVALARGAAAWSGSAEEPGWRIRCPRVAASSCWGSWPWRRRHDDVTEGGE